MQVDKEKQCKITWIEGKIDLNKIKTKSTSNVGEEYKNKAIDKSYNYKASNQ